jgi:hypothetical protein
MVRPATVSALHGCMDFQSADAPKKCNWTARVATLQRIELF